MDVYDVNITDIQAYSDDFQINNSSGQGYLVKQCGVVLTEVYDTEIIAAAAGPKAALNSSALKLA